MPTPPARRSTWRRGTIGLAGTIGLLASIAGPADAHVTATASDITNDGIATVEFEFHHGCDGQPTTALRVQIPDGVAEVVPQPGNGFTSAVTDGDFSWTGGSVPDGQSVTFVATMRVWGEAGETIWLKTLQLCPDGEEPWIEVQAAGEPEPEFMAPSIVLPSAIAAPETSATESTTTPTGQVTTTTVVASAITKEGTPTSTAGLIVFLVVCAIIAGGALTLYLRHRKRA